MQISSLAKPLSISLAVLLLLVIIAGFAVISNAKVVMTPGGANKSLRVPLGFAAVKFPIYDGTGENVFIQGYLAGPVVHRNGDGTWSASWFCQDQVLRANGNGSALRLECAGKQHVYSLADAPPEFRS